MVLSVVSFNVRGLRNLSERRLQHFYLFIYLILNCFILIYVFYKNVIVKEDFNFWKSQRHVDVPWNVKLSWGLDFTSLQSGNSCFQTVIQMVGMFVFYLNFRHDVSNTIWIIMFVVINLYQSLWAWGLLTILILIDGPQNLVILTNYLKIQKQRKRRK